MNKVKSISQENLMKNLINKKFLKLEAVQRLRYLNLCKKELGVRTEKFDKDLQVNDQKTDELKQLIALLNERVTELNKNYDAKTNLLIHVVTKIQNEMSETEKMQENGNGCKTLKHSSSFGKRNRITNIEKRLNYLFSEHSRRLKILNNELVHYKRELNRHKLLREQRVFKYKSDYAIMQEFINKLQLSLESLDGGGLHKDQQQIADPVNRRKFSYSPMLEETYYLEMGQRITKPWQFSYFDSLDYRRVIDHPKLARTDLDSSRKLTTIIPDIVDIRLHRRFNLNSYLNRNLK